MRRQWGLEQRLEQAIPERAATFWCRCRSGVLAEKFMRYGAQSDDCGSNIMPFESLYRRIQVEGYVGKAGCSQLPL